MTKSQGTLLLLLVICAVASSGCAKVMGNLRRDLDDTEPTTSPTVGGRWAEHGFLSENMSEGGPFADRYSAVGHSERNPSSLRENGAPSGDSWISPEQAEANRRDPYRNPASGEGPVTDEDQPVSFSNTPNLPPPNRRQYKNGVRATRADFVDESPNEASLWASDGQVNYYFTKNKIRTVGDIININLEPDMVRDTALEIRRTLTPVEKDREVELADIRLKNTAAAKERANAQNGGTPQAATPPAPGAPPKTDEPVRESATAADIDVAKSIDLKAGELIMAEIVERYPNGNYKIRGTKKIPYKNGSPRLVTLLGVIKSTDIAEDDTIASGKLYEYRLEAIR